MDDSPDSPDSIEELERRLASLKKQTTAAHKKAVVKQDKKRLQTLIAEETRLLEQIESKDYDPSKSPIGKTGDNSQKKSGVWESSQVTSSFAGVVTPKTSPPSQEWKVSNRRRPISDELVKWRAQNTETQLRLNADRFGPSNYNPKVGENHAMKFSAAIEKIAHHVFNIAKNFENNDDKWHELTLDDSDSSCRETILISSQEGQKLIASYGIACDSKYPLNVESYDGSWYVVR